MFVGEQQGYSGAIYTLSCNWKTTYEMIKQLNADFPTEDQTQNDNGIFFF